LRTCCTPDRFGFDRRGCTRGRDNRPWPAVVNQIRFLVAVKAHRAMTTAAVTLDG
jgi:hypothetical protein